jgi:hypothetical protein
MAELFDRLVTMLPFRWRAKMRWAFAKNRAVHLGDEQRGSPTMSIQCCARLAFSVRAFTVSSECIRTPSSRSVSASLGLPKAANTSYANSADLSDSAFFLFMGLTARSCRCAKASCPQACRFRIDGLANWDNCLRHSPHILARGRR